MIEDIKKEINKLGTNESYKNGKLLFTEIIKENVFKILDKYKDQNPYKQAWKELYSEKEKPCGIEYMQDLEEKYNLGGE